MKRILTISLIILISIFSVNAQNAINLNKNPFTKYQELNGVNSDDEFNDALRFREIKLNDDIQYKELIELNDIIQLDLFSDKSYKATVDKVKIDVTGTLLVRAKLNGYDHAYCYVSTFEGKSFMVIEIPENDELYMTRYNHDSKVYHLLEMDKAKLNPIEACFGDDLHLEDSSIDQEGKGKLNTPVVQKSPTTRDTITLLVAYTPAAAAWSAANEVNINNTISLMMARAELTNDNSDSLLYIELVHAQEVAYTELQSVQDLYNLRNTTDGNMDTVHTLRNTYCADLVTLLEQTSHTGGTAFLLNNLFGSPTNGFSILRVQQSSWTYTAIHEFGHNLGCGHNKFQNFQAGPGIFSYSSGSRWVSVPSGNFCSIMSYESGTYYVNGISHSRVAHFSNPTISYQGAPTGDSIDADNARSIRTTKSIVAGYRSGCSLPSAVSVSVNGNTFCNSATITASGGVGGTIYWQGTTRGGTSTATPSNSQVVTLSGTYYFRAQNAQGWGPQDSATVTIINSVPSQAGTISGVTAICPNQTQTYTVSAIPGADLYTWTLPSGATGISRTNSITVNFGTSAISGNITVTGNNTCGSGGASNLPIAVTTLPVNAGAISGVTTVCPSQSQTYTVPSISGATSYTLTLPSGATGTSTTNSITVSYTNAAVSGNITVSGVNSCGSGDTSNLAISVNPLPAAAGSISGVSSVCPSQSQTYTVPSISGATSYTWTLPSGATGTSTTDSITVTYTNAAVSGNISVSGNNSCGSGGTSNLAISVNPLPAAAGSISGVATVCPSQSQTYTVPSISGATSYTWTLPSGVTGTSTANSITVSYTNAATSGNITVSGDNSCGSGGTSNLAVTVNAQPPAPIISVNGNLLTSNAVNGNQWYNQNGLINGATNQTYTANIGGDYYSIVTLSGCSSDTSNILNVISTGIESFGENSILNVFPNPFSNVITIEIENSDEIINLEILNSSGQLVYKDQMIKKINIETSEFSKGIYFIKLESNTFFEIVKIVRN
tara:strand:- start:3415 stop:6429 length:3015 start_codon:yes stop_codon:yes gene_type:complete